MLASIRVLFRSGLGELLLSLSVSIIETLLRYFTQFNPLFGRELDGV